MRAEQLWFIDGLVYDLMPFVDHHPGGRRLIMGARGLHDATPLVHAYHVFKDMTKVKNMLAKYQYTGPVEPFQRAHTPLRPYTFADTGFYHRVVSAVRAEYDVHTDVRLLMYGRPCLLGLLAMGCFWSDWMWLFGIVQIVAGFVFWHDYEHGALGPPSNSVLEHALTLCTSGFDEDIWNLHHNAKHHAYTGAYGHDPDETTWTRSIPGVVLLLFAHLGQRLCYLRLPYYGRLWFMRDPGHLSPCRLVLYAAALEALVYWKTTSWLAVLWYIMGKSMMYMLLVYGDHMMPATRRAAQHMYRETTHPMDWGEAQVRASADFCVGHRITDWLMGGMNYQIEHHLFPALANAHYPRLAPIVRRVCTEMDIPYDDTYSLMDIVGAMLTPL
jgi:fatty acid desaturase